MATYTPSPGHFKATDADPEATLEKFTDYVDKMKLVFMISRRINTATNEKIEFDDAEKKAMLEIEGGQDMSELLKKCKVEDRDTYAQTVEKVKAALKGRGNRTSAVFKLFNNHQQGSRSFDSWHQDVVKAAKLIDWTGYDATKAAVDALVLQTSSQKLQQRAIQENPDLDTFIALGMSQEQARRKAASMPGGQEETVSRLQQENSKLRKKLEAKQPQQQAKKGSSAKCSKCCMAKCPDPDGSKCLAAGKVCLACGEKSHFTRSKLCKKSKKSPATSRIEEAHLSNSESEESVGRIMSVGKMENDKGMDSIYTSVMISSHEDENLVSGTKIQVATDTGVRKTILNRGDWRKIEDNCLLTKAKIKFRPYGTNMHLPVRGRTKVQLRAKAGALITTYVYVMDDDSETSLLGKRDAQRLGIVKIDLRGEKTEVKLEGEAKSDPCRRLKQTKMSDLKKERTKVNQEQVDDDMKRLVSQFSDVFDGIGKYRGEPVKIQMDDNIKPDIQAPRRIPLHYLEPLKQHLKELVENDVIEGPLTEEEEGSWISNLVITDKKWDESKPGERQQIRANLDLRPLNKHVYQTHEPIPTPDELKHKLKGSNKFTALDMVHSFHQFQLEEDARKLFTFRSPWGLYRYKRLVMGNSPASSECHRRVRAVLEGLEGVAQIKDDVLVYGKGDEHDTRLWAVLGRFRDAGLTLRREKCHFGQQEVKWFGHIFSEEGMSVDPEKVQLIKSWPRPRTVTEVKSFLQTVQFNAVYMAAQLPGELNFPELTEPLRALTRGKKKFTWSKEHETSFNLIKERLCGDHVMVPWDPDRDTRIYTDGGPEGCQATVAQRYQHPSEGEQWRPVAHSARAWTDPEKRYSQIEKESNALHSGIVSNKMYLLGMPFKAIVDHQPLLSLYNTPRRPKQMRVDRHRMKLEAYTFKVEHIPGSLMPCDYGSRRGCPPPRMYTEEEAEELGVELNDEIYVNRVVEEQLPYAITKDVLREALARDAKIMMLTEDIQTGACRKALTGYINVFEELSLVDGLVVRGDHQLVIPEELQPLVVQLAHEGHMGVDKTLGLLRESCWFPGMQIMAKEYVESCIPCQAAISSTPQEPMKATDLPDRPWQHVHADFKGPIGGSYYLHTIIDEYSKYPVVEVCKSTSWEVMRPMLDRAMGMLGIVDSMTTDNGPPYNSNEFSKYAKAMGFRHRKCTPENPQANGQVEVFQKVLAKLVHTATIERQDPRKVVQDYLRAYRSAPHKTTGKSPFEVMFGRRMNTKLPVITAKASASLHKELKEKHAREKEKQKQYADNRRRVKEKTVKIGDQVLVRRDKTSTKSPWDPNPYKVIEVKGSKVTAERGEQRKARAKNHLKVIRERPEHLKVANKPKLKEGEEYDLEVSKEAIQRMIPAPPQPHWHGQDGAGAEGEVEEPAQPEARPQLSSSESENDEEFHLMATNHREEAQLLDTLHGGAYWPVQEGAGRNRRAPDRLGVEQERGFWEERLPRELSMEEHGPRQITTQGNEYEECLTREPSMEEHGSKQNTPQVSPQPTPLTSPQVNMYTWLPASRMWDEDEVRCLQLDMDKPPMSNLVCLDNFCPAWTGEEEPTEMQGRALKE